MVAGWPALWIEAEPEVTEPVVIDADQLGQITDQLWRRLGITQTFDRLLVEATAASPGELDAVCEFAGRNLSEGAARFWTMSFPQIKKDLCRRRVLAESGGALGLSEEFVERLRRVLADLDAGVSHVAPTPGVTLEEVQARTARREERDKAKKAATRKTSSAKSKSTAKSKEKGASTPKTRKAKAVPEAALGGSEPAPAPSAPPTPAAKLFTSRRLNALLDRLGAGALLKSQLGSRLEIAPVELERFLQVTEKMEITRSTRDDMVELHFKGREFAQTSGVDRRTTVRQLVNDSRALASD